MSTRKNAKFFCENCNTEVKQNAKFCPKCGRFFASVKCPQCGKIGASNEFTKGCPRCGYAIPPKDNNSHLSSSNNANKKQKKHYDDSLPPWIYLLSIALLGIMLIVLLRIL